MGSVNSSHEFQITTDPENQLFPAIYKDIVVYQDNRHGNSDIYGNLKTADSVDSLQLFFLLISILPILVGFHFLSYFEMLHGFTLLMMGIPSFSTSGTGEHHTSR